MKPSGRLNGISEYYFSAKLAEIRRMNQSGEQVINLGIGNPDLPPPPPVVAELNAAVSLPSVHGYQSYTGSPELRSALAAWYLRYFGVSLDPETEVLPVMGSKEAIFQASLAYLEPGYQVLVPDPGYPTYRSAGILAGAGVVSYPLEASGNWHPDLEALSRTDLSKARIMWVNYPHMPTGAAGSGGLFRDLVSFAREHNILICHDNPYVFVLNDTPLSILSVPGAGEVCIELTSLSKSYNMAGWRIGFVAGNREILKNILLVSSNYQSGMFQPLQKAAVRALTMEASWFTRMNEVYAGRKRVASRILKLLDCRFEPGQAGMFLWARIPGNSYDELKFSDEILHACRVFLTPGSIFGNLGKGYIRLSLCQPTEVLASAEERIVNWLKTK